MKKIIVIFLVAMSFVFFSCSKEQLPAARSGASVTDQNNTSAANTGKFADPSANIFVSCDKWFVSMFSINETDQAAAYKNYSLIFCPGNSFTISNDILSKTGTWSFGNAGVLGVLDFQMGFNDGNIPIDAWRNLQDTWNVQSYSSDKLSLQTAAGNKTLVLVRLAH